MTTLTLQQIAQAAVSAGLASADVEAALERLMQPTLRDDFAMSVADEESDYSDAVKVAIVGRSIPSLATDGALALLQFEAEFRAKWRYLRADAMLAARAP